MPALFISYRRSDSSDITGRIFDRLVGYFGNKPVKVIRDLDSIPFGEDFREVLRDKIQSCDVVLVIIGPNWTTVKDSKGSRRLDDAADTVRIEIEQALELKKKVIPVCVTHADMPTEDDLPLTLKKLAFRNGVQVRPDPDFNNDISRLMGALDKIFKDKQIADARPPTLPPPQRHFHPPEPPPPPPVDTRRANSSHGPSGGSPFAPPTSSAPVIAEVVNKGPTTPHQKTPPPPPQPPARPKGDSSPGNAAPRHPAAGSSPFMPPPAAGQRAARPLMMNRPNLSKSWFTSAAGIGILLAGLVTLCLCGGWFAYFCVTIAGKDYEREIRKDIEDHPAVIEHLGDIVAVEWVFAATGLPSGPGGETSDLFKVTGTKGTAEVIGHTEGGISGGMVGDTLRLLDGKEISLHESYSPQEASKGFSGEDFHPQINWKWTPTAEESFLTPKKD